MPHATRRGDSTRITLEPPAFSPTREMRGEYLGKRKNEIDTLLFQAKENDWKGVILVLNHIRGSGAMYGFEAIGNAADDVVRAVQNGKTECRDLLRIYAGTVAAANL